MERNATKGILFGALSAASYGVNPVALYLYQDGFSSITILMYRYIFAVIFMAILLLAKKESFRCTSAELKRMVLMGIFFSFSSLTLFESYRHIAVSISSTLLFSYPAFVAIIMTLIYGEKLSKLQIAGIAMVVVGVYLLNVKPGEGEERPLSETLIGVTLVIVSSLMYAIYIVATKQDKALANVSSLKLSFYSILFGSFVFILPPLFTGTDGTPFLLTTSKQWLSAISLGLFPTLISVTLLAYAIRYVGPTITALLGAFEPIAAVLIGILLFGERPSTLSYISMLIIFFGISIVILRDRQKAKKA